jgi:hypothetical protein
MSAKYRAGVTHLQRIGTHLSIKQWCRRMVIRASSSDDCWSSVTRAFICNPSFFFYALQCSDHPVLGGLYVFRQLLGCDLLAKCEP